MTKASADQALSSLLDILMDQEDEMSSEGEDGEDSAKVTDERKETLKKELQPLSSDDFKAKCKQYGIKIGGIKRSKATEDLVEYLLKHGEEESEKEMTSEEEEGGLSAEAIAEKREALKKDLQSLP